MSSERSQWTIRHAVEADIPALIEMQREGWTVDYVGYMPEGYGDMAMQRYGKPETIRQHIDDYVYYFVAEQDGVVIGTICGDNLNATEAEIWWIHVPKSHRGSGMGRALVDYFIQQMPAHIETLYVTTFDGYSPTIAFYERVGFTPHERMVNHYDGVAVHDVRLRLLLQR
jgi:ribosomal protein S18 acetylase RimI-like enzyme